MPDQNFETDQNQDDAAGLFCFGLVEDSEYSADFNADHAAPTSASCTAARKEGK